MKKKQKKKNSSTLLLNMAMGEEVRALMAEKCQKLKMNNLFNNNKFNITKKMNQKTDKNIKKTNKEIPRKI